MADTCDSIHFDYKSYCSIVNFEHCISNSSKWNNHNGVDYAEYVNYKNKWKPEDLHWRFKREYNEGFKVTQFFGSPLEKVK